MTLKSRLKNLLSQSIIVSIVAGILSACSDKVAQDPEFPVVEMSLEEELCLSNTFGSKDGLNISQENLYKLLGAPNTSEDIDITVRASGIFRGHLVEKANAAVARNESLIVREATWNIGPCRMTVWLWPDSESSGTAFSSTQYHKDSLF